MRINVRLFGLLSRHVPGYDYAEGMAIDAREGSAYRDLIPLLNLPADKVGLFNVGGIMKQPEDLIEDGQEVKIFMPLAGG